MKLYNQVYGKYTAGTGSWLNDEVYEKGKNNIYNREILEYYKSIISIDLSRINLLGSLNKLKVMDVGTGRQAIALYELGAHSVDHYDISLTNTKNFNNYINKNRLSIRSIHADICKPKFNDNKKYDFIYLQGIIQHVKNPFEAIENLSKATNINGVLWFYNYQAGAVNHIYIEAFREILSNNIDQSILSNYLMLAGFSAKNVDSILDNYGCTYRHLIKNKSYKNHLQKCGFTEFYSKDMINQSNGLDLRVTTNACITGHKKKTNIISFLKTPTIKHIDHFNSKNYILEQQKFIDEVSHIKNKINYELKKITLSNYDLISICLPLFRGYLFNKTIQPFEETKINILNSFKSSLYLLQNKC